MQIPTQLERIGALARVLGQDPDQIRERSFPHRRHTFTAPDGRAYRVLTEEEARARAKGYILDNLWKIHTGTVFNFMRKPENLTSSQRAAALQEFRRRCQEEGPAINQEIRMRIGSRADILAETLINDAGYGAWLPDPEFRDQGCVQFEGFVMFGVSPA